MSDAVDKSKAGGRVVDTRPDWKPNGKTRPVQSDNLPRFRATTRTPSPAPSVSASRSSVSSSLNAKQQNAPASSHVWKHVIRTKAEPAIFLSSHDLAAATNSTDVKTAKKKLNDSKDIGGGWRPVYKPKVDPPGFLRPKTSGENDDNNNNNGDNKPKKKTLVVDEKDVGGGWKPVYKPKVDPPGFLRPKASGESDENNNNNNGENKPKKKVLVVDEKDVGGGWKPFIRKSTDELFKPFSSVDDKLEPSSKTDPTLKVLRKSKEANTVAWKPSGAIKKDDYPRHIPPPLMPPSPPQAAQRPHAQRISKKDSRPVTAAAKSAKPASTTTSPLGKTKPMGGKVSKSVNKVDVIELASARDSDRLDRMVTSTPNESRRLADDEREEDEHAKERSRTQLNEDKLLLEDDESVLKESPDHDNEQPKTPQNDDEDESKLNEKIGDDELVDKTVSEEKPEEESVSKEQVDKVPASNESKSDKTAENSNKEKDGADDNATAVADDDGDDDADPIWNVVDNDDE